MSDTHEHGSDDEAERAEAPDGRGKPEVGASRPAPAPEAGVVGRADLTPSPATRREWRDRGRRWRAGLAIRMLAPLAAVAILEAARPRPHQDLARRAAASVRLALLVVVVALPVGWLLLSLVAARLRRRDRLRPLPAGVRYAGRAAVDARTGGPAGALYLRADRSRGWYEGAQRPTGDIHLIHDQSPGAHGLRWVPHERARGRGFQPFWIPAADVRSAEVDVARPRRGDARINLLPDGYIDFEISDMSRFARAVQGSWLAVSRPVDERR